MDAIEKVKAKMGFIGGQFLDSKALPESGVQVTIKNLQTEMVQNMRTFKDEEKKILYFEELPLGMVLGAKCNRVKLIKMVSESSKELIGKKITIYLDPKVKFGRETVGAIRIK